MNRLSRRGFLRGLGATLTLPALDVMRPRRARAQASEPLRFVAFFVPNGMHMPAFTPASEGPLVLSRALSALEGLRDDVLLISNLANVAAEPQGDGAGDHARGTATFLTCAHPRRAAAGVYNGVSIDQLFAQRYLGETRLPSLELGAEHGPNAGTCDSRYSCAYQRNISWATATQPAPKEINPRAVFDRLFGADDPQLSEAERARRRALRLSVLDFVKDDALRLKPKLGAADRARVDEYMTSVREVERRIQASAELGQCESGPRPEGVPADPVAHVKLLLDLAVLALRCDVTRVCTFMLGDGGSNRTFPFLDIHSAHHELSHHQNDAGKHQALERINHWELSLFAHLLRGLRAVETSDGDLLDHTAVFFSSELADGNAHDHRGLPVLLGGRAGGAIAPGRHLVAPTDTPIANLFRTLLHAGGVEVERFGDDGTDFVAGLAG